MFVNPGPFFVIPTWKLVDQDFYSQFSSLFGFDALNSGYTSFCDSEIIVSYIIWNNQYREIGCNFFHNFTLTTLLIWQLIYWVPFWILKDALIANAIFQNIFWQLKVTQPVLCFWINQLYMFLNQRYVFVSSSHCFFMSFMVGFVVTPVENILLGLTPEKFRKFGISPSEVSSPHKGAVTGCASFV